MKSASHTVAVIMTVKNGEEFLDQSLYSVAGQSHPPKQFIVVDDGSDDHGEELIRDFSENIFHVDYIKTEGIGRAAALNLAWQACECDWVANLDVDDCWHPKKLEIQVRSVEYLDQCSMLITDSEIVEGRSDVLWDEGISTDSSSVAPVPKREFFSMNPVNHSSVMINRDVLRQLGGYNESLRSQIDYDLWVKVLYSGFSICKVPKKLSAKRLHSKQSFEAKKRFTYLCGSFRANISGLRSLEAPIYYYWKPVLSFSFGILPRSLRSLLKSCFFK